jgi:hypothetical protein
MYRLIPGYTASINTGVYDRGDSMWRQHSKGKTSVSIGCSILELGCMCKQDIQGMKCNHNSKDFYVNPAFAFPLQTSVGAWLLLLPLVFHFENKVAKAKKKHSAALRDIHISVYRFFYIYYIF